ncbi:MAG: hypothetical protein ACFFDW_03995 [Candidatus Thorarchaeota archaeon]
MIPDWIVVKKIDELSIPREKMKIDLEQWPKIARERIRKFTQGARWYPSRSINRGPEDQEIYEELAGHGLLRLLAAEDNRIFGWLIEQEGDLFEWRFMNSKTIQEKIEIAQYFFGENKVLGPRELWAKFNIEDNYFKDFKGGNKRTGVIGVYFSCVPKMVGNRSALIRDGWVISTVNEFSNGVKMAFESRLRERIKESGERMDRSVRSFISEIKEELSKMIHSISSVSGKIDIGDYDLFNRQDIFPQCMLDLYNEVMSKGHIGHGERFQLGLYLKRLGMSIDEQLRFWYKQAVDNIGISYDQFINGNAGYIIRHMYGLEGGETDYDAPSCNRIQGEYYCTFMHQSIEEIDRHLRAEFKSPSYKQEELIRSLESKVIEKKPSEACAILFNLRYQRFSKPVFHPIGYSTYAAKVKKIIQIEEPDEEKNHDENNMK